MDGVASYIRSLMDLSGRFNRLDFLYAVLALGASAFIFGGVTGLLLAGWPLDLVGYAYSLLCIYVNACSAIKRMRDLERSPWFLLLIFVPLINAALILYLFLWPGKPPIDAVVEREHSPAGHHGQIDGP